MAAVAQAELVDEVLASDLLAAAAAGATQAALTCNASSAAGSMIIDGQRAHDCTPTLTDSEVADSCRDGVMSFEGVVPEHINHRCRDFLDASSAAAGIQGSGIGEPVELFAEAWFVDTRGQRPAVPGGCRRRPDAARTGLRSADPDRQSPRVVSGRGAIRLAPRR